MAIPNPALSQDIAELTGAASATDSAGATASLFAAPAPSAMGNWRDGFPEIIGRSPAMSRVLETVWKVSRSEGAVLITGPSGTGKELIASAIHRLSPRSGKRFTAINCSAIPEDLLESELFGHEKGAFTGAERKRLGYFEVSAGGTIFLDEIGDMPARLQAKLLRVLQERKFTPVGGNELRSADVRIIAATNVNLQKAVEEGRFRLDLFYRLNVLPVEIPALRERQPDVAALLDYFLDIANRNHSGSPACYFTDEVIACLSAYSWPGNVRELQNLVERLVVLSGGGAISIDHLPPEVAISVAADMVTPPTPVKLAGATVQDRPAASMPLAVSATPIVFPASFGELPLPETGLDLPTFIEGLENSLIMQALERTQNNKNQAARLLGLNRTTLVERIKKRKIATNLGGDSEI